MPCSYPSPAWRPFRRRFTSFSFFVCLVACARCASILTDFGQAGYETTLDSSGRRWNNVTQNAAAGSSINLVDTTNASSGITLTLTASFNLGDYNTNGDTSAGLPYPATATRDSLVGNVGAFGGASNVVPVLTLSGLDPAKTCDLTFFASRSESDNRIANYIVQGATTGAVFLDANGPAPHTATLAGVMPAADGTVKITIKHATVAESGLPLRGAGDYPTGFTYLGVLEITLPENGGAPPGSVRPLVIMPLGSSITAGQSAQSPYNGGGYRTPLYQALEADGRFAPAYVGSSTTLMANSPTATNILTTAGQLRHEGHPGYTTTQTIGNLTASDGSGGNNGGHWLEPGNGFDPAFITLNMGGNDFVKNHNDTAAITRLDTLVGELAALRPNATIIVSSIVYRPDIGAYIDLYYNPFIEDLVFRHVLAGRRVRYLDLRTIMGTGYLSSDNIHPTQAGYNVMGAAWYQAVVNGAAYWTGSVDANWSTLPTGGRSNWATDATLLTLRATPPDAGSDVYFSSPAGIVDAGADLSIRSLNFGAGASTPIVIASGRMITIGRGGISVQVGSAAHEIQAALIINGPQTWASVGSRLTLTGSVDGCAALTISGTGEIVLNGANTHTGAITVKGGTLRVNGSTASASDITVASGGTLAGLGVVGGTVTCQRGSVLSPGQGSGRLRTGDLVWVTGAAYEWDVQNADGVAGVGYDNVEAAGQLSLAGLSAASPARLILRGDPAMNFHSDQAYTWTIMEAAGGVSGFDAGAFIIDTFNFGAPLSGGVFSVSADAAHVFLHFTPAPTLRSKWRHRFFGVGDNAGGAADLSDPDGDGLCNLLEYALGGDPLISDSAPVPVIGMLTQSGAPHLTLTFVPTADPALAYSVESSVELRDAWSSIWSGSNFTNGAPITVIDPQALAKGGRFLRLRVSF